MKKSTKSILKSILANLAILLKHPHPSKKMQNENLVKEQFHDYEWTLSHDNKARHENLTTSKDKPAVTITLSNLQSKSKTILETNLNEENTNTPDESK